METVSLDITLLTDILLLCKQFIKSRYKFWSKHLYFWLELIYHEVHCLCLSSGIVGIYFCFTDLSERTEEEGATSYLGTSDCEIPIAAGQHIIKSNMHFPCLLFHPFPPSLSEIQMLFICFPSVTCPMITSHPSFPFQVFFLVLFPHSLP